MATDPLEAPYPATVCGMESWMAESYGDLVRVADGGGTATFSELYAASGVVAQGLIGAGQAKGTRVGILLPNGNAYAEVLTGITRMGGHAVLLSTLARPPELAFMIRHADLDAVIMADRYLGHDYVAELEEALPSLRGADGTRPLRLPEVPYLRTIWLFGAEAPQWARGTRADLAALGSDIDATFLAAVEAQVVPADPAILIYSSGSTAEPKAIVHSHGNLARQSWRMSRHMTFAPGDRLMTTMPFFWVGGLCTSMLAANLRGAAIVCPDRPSIEGMRDAMDGQGVTHAALWPAQLAALTGSAGFGDVCDRLKPTSAQQMGLFGLATVERTPNSLGMTETLGPHSMELFGATLPQGREGSYGRAVGGIERRIVDPATGTILPVGAEGELTVRGGATMLGFHRKERDEVFDRDGFYHTGDIGRISADGYLFFTGRGGDMVKTGGANVSPREVEEALMVEPEVAEAAVLGLADPVLGEKLVAAVILREGFVTDEATLDARLRAKLSSYKVPRHILFLAPEDMPRTASAKIRRPALSSLLARMTQV